MLISPLCCVWLKDVSIVLIWDQSVKTSLCCFPRCLIFMFQTMSADLGANVAELTGLVDRLIYENRCLLESQSWKTLHIQILKDRILRLEQNRRRVRFSNKVTVYFI